MSPRGAAAPLSRPLRAGPAESGGEGRRRAGGPPGLRSAPSLSLCCAARCTANMAEVSRAQRGPRSGLASAAPGGRPPPDPCLYCAGENAASSLVYVATSKRADARLGRSSL